MCKNELYATKKATIADVWFTKPRIKSEVLVSSTRYKEIPIETIATRSEALINVITSGTLKKNKIKNNSKNGNVS